MIEKLFENRFGPIIITIIIGIGLACIFRTSCENGLCITYLSPPDLDGAKFRWKNNCYQYKRINVNCPALS